MNVTAILKQKGTSVTTVTSGSTVDDAAQTLAQKRIGAVVVTDGDERVAGIVSERDIVRAIAEGGAGILSRPVTGIMTKNVVTCTDSATLDELMQIMTRGRFRHLPVVDAQGRLAGIVSIGDVVKFHIGEIAMEAAQLREYIANH
jgi:CBS domain-containing protein